MAAALPAPEIDAVALRASYLLEAGPVGSMPSLIVLVPASLTSLKV